MNANSSHYIDVDLALLERIRRRVQVTRAQQARNSLSRVRFAFALAVLALCTDAAAAFYAFRPTPPLGPLQLADGGNLAAALANALQSGYDFRLSDGSRIKADPATRLSLLENSGSELSLLLIGGRLEVAAAVGSQRRWRVDTALASFEGVGSIFVVQRSEETVRVDAIQGDILARGPGVPEGVRRLTPGEGAAFETFRARDPTQPTMLVSPVSVVDPVPSVVSNTSLRTVTAGWRELAARHAFAEAFASLGEGGIALATRDSSVDDLFALSDVARLGGHPNEAIKPLELILDKHGADPRAPLAAYTLGKLFLATNPAACSSAFSRALSLGVPASLREDALVHLIECRMRVGDKAGGLMATEQHLREFPESGRRTEIERWVQDAR